MAAPVLARVAAALLTNEDGRKTIGWVLALLLSPLILLVVFLCCFGDGASQHNNAVVSAAFYGAELSSQIPAEYRAHITEMQEAFSLLDSAIVYVNQKAEEGSLDPVQVKAVFFALCFGDNAPTRAAADRFVDCSPFEVLAYFRNAEEVITDTFHGSIFSVITHRPFTTLIRKSVGNSYGNEEKLSDLLERLELANRMTTKIEDAENINEKAIDYAKVDERLKAHREVAKEYLRKKIEG